MNGLKHCDGCDKLRKDVQSCGRDPNGEPDAPDLCFCCRKKAERKAKTGPPLDAEEEDEVGLV